MKKYITCSKRELANQLGQYSTYFDSELVDALKQYNGGQFASVADEIGHKIESMIATRYANRFMKWDLEDIKEDLAYYQSDPNAEYNLRGSLYVASAYYDARGDRLLIYLISTLGIYWMGYAYVVYENGHVCCIQEPTSELKRRGTTKIWPVDR